MKYEKNSGAVIYTVQARRRLYLIKRMQKGHVSVAALTFDSDRKVLQ